MCCLQLKIRNALHAAKACTANAWQMFHLCNIGQQKSFFWETGWGCVFQSNISVFSIPFSCPSSWLEEDDDPVVAKVNQRMQQITGLTVKTAELLQVGTLLPYQDEI